MSDIKDAALESKHLEPGHNDLRHRSAAAVNHGDGQVAQKAVKSVALADALLKDDNEAIFSADRIRLYAIVLLVTFNDMLNGFDGSLMSAINAMPPFHSTFGVGMEGSSIGLVFAIYTVGGIVGCLFAAPVCDLLGRRAGMFATAIFTILGTIIQATGHTLGAFLGGRFLLGFAVVLGQTAGPTYIVEMAPPTWRGFLGGFYHSFGFYVGAIVAGWVTYGTFAAYPTSDWSWRIPIICQAGPALVICAFVWLLPESPRWLVAHGRSESARAILTKYHGAGNPNSAIVELEMNEIEAGTNLEIESRDNRWWDYRKLFNTRPALYRIWLLMLVSVFSQFIGGAVISYYTPVILENIGITSSSQQLLLNALNIVFSFLGAFVGSFTVEKFGRRQLFLWGTFLTGCCYIPMNVIAAQADGHVATGTGYTFVAFIFLYGITFSFCWTPLQSLYPAEIMPNDIRAQGMAFQNLASQVASFINTYATPVALQNIGWKTYTIFLVLHFVQLFAMWWSVVETKGRTLEELDEIFQHPHPVKKSLEKHIVVAVRGEGVKGLEDA